MLPSARPAARPVYVYNGVRYESLEQLQAALRNTGVEFVADDIRAGATSGPCPGEHWKAAVSGAKQYLQQMNSLLEDPLKFRELVRSLFAEYGGPDRRLQQDEALWLMVSLGAQIGVANPTQVFGEVQQIFHRFDFSGTGELDEAECEHLVRFILRKARDRLSPCTGMRLCHLPLKSLHAAYVIEKQLGQGGQGVVFLAREKSESGGACSQRVVKQYSKADANAPLDDIKDEFTLLRQLDHPTIARVLDIFEDNANVYVVSEPYFGGDLTTLIAKAGEHGVVPTVGWVTGVFKQVLEGLAYLHLQMIMHCDMKEPNIMVANDSDWNTPHVVIIDFGMAKDFGGARAGGTPGYMPPEVWEVQLWTPRGDIFALACVFWSIFNGRQGGPFLVPDAPPFARIRMLTCQHPIDCSKFPSGLRELTERMASKDFRLRPTSKQALAQHCFQSLGHWDAPLDTGIVDTLRRTSEQRGIQNLIAMELMGSENLGQLRQLNELFQRLDLDNDGAVDVVEAREALARLGMEAAQVERLIAALVGDKGGSINYSEFMAKLLLAQRGVREEQLAAVFASIDTDGSGTLDVREIEALLARRNMERIMEGRSARDIINEMDRDGNGIIDFAEFRRAMLGEDPTPLVGASTAWAEGDAARYFSRSNNMWLSCRITGVHASTGCVEVDVKHGYWLTPEEQRSLLLRGHRTWAVGDACRYYSQSRRSFVDCRVQAVNTAGAIMVDFKPGVWLPAWTVSEPGKGATPETLGRACQAASGEAYASSPSGQACGVPVSLQRSAEGGVAWAVGDLGVYFSRRQGVWLNFVITAVDPVGGAVQLNVKPEYWMPLEEQQQVLRRA